MADEYRTVSVPGHGDVDFPSSMSDEDIAGVLRKQFAPQGPSKLDQFLSGPKAPGRQPFATPQLNFSAIPDASIATAAGKEKRQQIFASKAPQRAAEEELAGQVDANPALGFHGALPLTPSAPATPQAVAGQSALATQAQSQTERTREREQLMGLRASGNAQARKAIAQRLAAANQAVGGTESDPSGSAALLKQGAETPLLPYALQAAGIPGTDPAAIIQKQLAKAPGDSTAVAVAKGAGRGLYGAAAGLTTPENLALLAGLAPESEVAKLAGAAFTAQAGTGAVQSGREVFRRIGEGDVGGAVESGVDAGINAAFAGLGVLHGISELRTGRSAAPGVSTEGAAPFTTDTVPVEGAPMPSERRGEGRKRVSQMTREELENSYVKHALTDDITGLHNYRAFKEMHEDNPSPVGFSDVDGLKALNDTYGHAAGDALLKAKADALRQAGLEAYRKGGDEFLTRAASQDELRAGLDKANQILANTEIKFKDPKTGQERVFKGAGFSYGVADTEEAADAGMLEHKNKREALGLRQRGSMGTMKEVLPPEPEVAPIPEAQKPAEAQSGEVKPQATNPSEATPQVETPKTPIAPLEDKLRRTIGSVIRTRQLKKAATDRLNVELGLRTVMQTKLPEQIKAEIAEAKKSNPNAKPRIASEENVGALADRKLAPNELKPQRLAMVESVARALGKTPKDLYAEQYRLSDAQVAQLRDMLKQGTKTLSLKGIDHPEAPFAENAPYPLADINTNNAAMAGVTNPKDLWTRLGKKVNDARKSMSEGFRLGAKGEAGQEGMTAAQLERAGLVRKGGKDIDTLMFEHENMQKVLDDHLKKLTKVLGPLHDEWQKARQQETGPSPLAQQVAKLSRASKAGLPAGLYAKEHLGAETPDTAKSTVAKEPLPTPEAATQELPPSATTAEIESKIDGLIKTIQERHGDKGAAGLQHLHMAATEKYKNEENVLRAFHAGARHFLANLEKGDEEALSHAISDTIDKFPAEKDGATLYANPIGPILSKLFGKNKLTVTAPFPKGPTTLPQSPMADLVAKLDTQPKVSTADSAKAFINNQVGHIDKMVREAPDVTAGLIQKVSDAVEAAWKAYAERPGLTPLQWQLGRRQLRLQANAIIMHKFVKRMNELHPDLARREAMVNYLQAGGGVLPERDVLANLKLKENAFANAGAVAKKNLQLKNGYRDAQTLDANEKQTIANYRAYDKELNRQEEAEGLELQGRENYIRQIWDKDSLAAKQINAAFTAGSFTTNPSFMKMRRFEDYFEGEMAGFTPHNKDFAYLVSARARASAEVLANKEMIQALYHQTMPTGEKMVVPDGVGVPQGMTRNPDGKLMAGALMVKQAIPKEAIAADGRPYVRINHSSFQNWKWVGKVEGGLLPDGSEAPDTPVMFRGSMLAHPDVAPQLKRILEPSAIRQNPIGHAALTMSSIGKQTLLIGLFHPVQLGIHFLEHAGEGISDGTTTSRTMKAINPFADPIIDLEKDERQKLLVMHGTQVADFHAESMFDEGVMSHGLANGAPIVGKFLSNLHDAMFQRYIPNLKMSMALDALDRNLVRYHDKYRDQILQKNPGLAADAASRMAQSKIYRMTSEQMNAAFGGLNWENLPISKTWQDFARLTVLAPDFLLARMQFVGDSLRPGGAESRKALLIGAFVQYTAARAFNAAMNDGDPKWAIQDWNKFIVGRHEYSLRTVQGDLVDSVMDPRRFWSHRLNPLTLRPVVEAITQKDVFGHPASAGQELIDFSKNFVPMPLQGAVDSMVGHFDPSKRIGKNDEQLADTVLQSLGVMRKKYRSPAARYTFEEFDKVKTPASDDDLAIEQKNTFKRLREKYEEGKLHPNDLGKALKNGTLKPTEIKYLFKTANETQLVREARQLQPHQVLKSFNLGTEMEKYELAPLVLAKLSKFPPQEQAQVAAQVQSFLKSIPKTKYGELQKKIGEEIEYESPLPKAPEPEPQEEEEKPEENQ